MATRVFFLLEIAVLMVAPWPAAAVLLKQPPLVLEYHNGTLLKGNYTLELVWFGDFAAAQRAIIVAFLSSLSADGPPAPSVVSWWRTTEAYNGAAVVLTLGRQHHLSATQTTNKTDVRRLAAVVRRRGAIAVVLTAADVPVEGFCVSRCGTHGRRPGGSPFVWVGNAETQCPGQCAWPFHQPIYGPQTPPLVAPNGDVGADGMVINLAAMLAATATNPFGDGYYQGPKEAPLEAASACAGIFGHGAYPGFPGYLKADPATGGNFNAAGPSGRKFLLPAVWDPKTSRCVV